MSFGSNGVDIALVAAADQTSSQYRAGDVDASGNFAVATAAGQACIGVLQNNPGSGQAATIRVAGVTKMLAGAAVAAGAQVKSDATGRAVTATTATTNTSDAGAASDPLVGSFVLGRALKAAGGAGEIIPVLWEPCGAVPTTAA